MDNEGFQRQFKDFFEVLHLVQVFQCGILQQLCTQREVKIVSSPVEETIKYCMFIFSGFYSRHQALRHTTRNSEPSRPAMTGDGKGDRCPQCGQVSTNTCCSYNNTATSLQPLLGPVANSNHVLHNQYSQLQQCSAADPWGKGVSSTHFSLLSSRS